LGTIGLGIFPVGQADEEVGMGVGRGETDDAGLIAEGGGVGVWRWVGKREEGATATGVAKEGGGGAATGADDEVVETIAVEIEPGDAWTGLAEATREEGLAGEVVEGLVVMSVVEEGGKVLEMGGGGREGGGRIGRTDGSRVRSPGFRVGTGGSRVRSRLRVHGRTGEPSVPTLGRRGGGIATWFMDFDEVVG
jgi:hypothetical protein